MIFEIPHSPSTFSAIQYSPARIVTCSVLVGIPPPYVKSFVQTFNNPCTIFLSQLPKPCIKGSTLAIKISKDEYQLYLMRCQNNLHCRVTMSKSDTPIILSVLRDNILNIWKPIGSWQAVPVWKGLYKLSFTSREDL